LILAAAASERFMILIFDLSIIIPFPLGYRLITEIFMALCKIDYESFAFCKQYDYVHCSKVVP
jgi:hypothetical protein